MLVDWIKVNRKELLIVAAVFVVALLPRVLDLGTFLTADEKNWIGRSFEFIRAFKDYRFNDMLQTTHPGVTTLWAAGISITGWMLVAHIPFSFQNIEHFVTAAQFPVALLNALAVPFMYLLLRRLIDWRVAVLASLLIALNPFLIGYSRVAHVDALLASFVFLGVLATLVYARESFARKWLIVSATVAALAILTKAPGVFLAPWFWLVVLVHRPINWKERIRDFVMWLLIVGILFVLIWPAIIFVPNPEGNVLLLKRDYVEATVTPHHMADTYNVALSHYPATLLTRTTPITFLLVSLVIGLLLFRTFSRSHTESHVLISLLLAYVFFFIVMMTLGAKKGDRYVLPVFLALDVLAAIGIAWVASKWRWKRGFLALSSVAIVLLVLTVIWYHPYTIAYSNPLFPDNLSQELGWGEGLDKVGAWLSENHPDSVVASWYPSELGAYTSASVAHINAHEQGKVRFVVLYRNMFGRASDHYANDFIDEYYSKREPVFVSEVVGKPFAWVYEKWAFEQIVGELTPGRSVAQTISVEHDGLAGLEVLVATYSGRANEGTLVVTAAGQTWRVSVGDIENDRWLRLEFDELREVAGAEINVRVAATGTREKNAPTIRYTRIGEYHEGDLVIDGEQKPGDMAVRLFYAREGQLVNEEQTKLLE